MQSQNLSFPEGCPPRFFVADNSIHPGLSEIYPGILAGLQTTDAGNMLEAEFPRTFPRITPGDQSDKITATASKSRSTSPRVIPKAAAASSTPQLCRHACQLNGWPGLGCFPHGVHSQVRTHICVIEPALAAGLGLQGRSHHTRHWQTAPMPYNEDGKEDSGCP